MFSTTFGDWLKERRLANGWTQKELAEKANVPQTTISYWETGKTKLFLFDERIVQIANAFNLRLCELPFDLLEGVEQAKNMLPDQIKPPKEIHNNTNIEVTTHKIAVS